MASEKVSLAHGAGGKKTDELIRKYCFNAYGNSHLNKDLDAAILQLPTEQIAFTTDSFVVDPVIFPGGDIGKLAVCGTVNDLAVVGAKPLYLTIGLILEEGFSLDKLQEIMASTGEAARNAGVEIVAGDTKVVNKNSGDEIFINTSGIGLQQYMPASDKIEAGDKIIISASIANHGLAIMAAREQLELSPPIISDCTNLNYLTEALLTSGVEIKFMRDPTRGGLATVLNEFVSKFGIGITIREDRIPVKKNVDKVCSMLGMDPLYMANEGCLVIIAKASDAKQIVSIINEELESSEAAIIGEIVSSPSKRVVMETSTGSLRILPKHISFQLPRIC